jgi:plasmid stabilization system protein ParE
VAHIGAHNPLAAQQQNRLVQQAARRLLVFPRLGAPDAQALRALQVPGTPFRLIYQETRDAIVILRVWHGARQWPPAST